MNSTTPPRHHATTPPGHPSRSLLGLQQEHRHDTDTERVFRQESYFNWAFGVKEPEFLGAIDIDTGKTTLLMPRLSPVW